MTDLEKAIKMLKIPVNHIKDETGLHHDTVTKAMRGESVSIKNYNKVVSWLKTKVGEANEIIQGL